VGRNGKAASQETGEPLDPTRGFLFTRLAGVISALDLPEDEAEGILAHAGDRGAALAQAAGGGAAAAQFAETAAIAQVLAGLAAANRLGRQRVDRLTRRLARKAGLPSDLVKLVLYVEALRDPQLLELPPDQAIEAQLRLLIGFAPVSEVSLWTSEPNGRPHCLLILGDGPATRRLRAAARAAMIETEERITNERGFIHAIPVLRWGHPVAALVVRARPEERERALVFAEEATATLASAIARQALLEQNAEGERSLVESSERRLARIGLDLHDGPIQELAAFAGDLRLLRRQLTRVVDGHEHGDLVLGRIDDLEARLVELDRELRELAVWTESSALMAGSFPELLSGELQAFAGRHRIDAELAVRGRFDFLTPSQRITILRIIQEALTNVQAHSEASEVTVTVFPGRTHVSVEVTDNGRGFDVERTLVQAARKGRLGLVGMSERVRLLGGRFDLQSSPGGPTTISAKIPRWRPLEAENEAESGDSGAATATLPTG
jgi:two-component system sensor histidine kinase NreB